MKTISPTPLRFNSTKLVDAIVMDDGFLERIGKISTWSVHSVFLRAINLLAGEDLITIATAENSLMPYTLISSAVEFGSINTCVNQTVKISNNEISIGKCLTIKLNGKIESSKLPLNHTYNPESGKFLTNCQRLKEIFQNKRASGSFFIDDSASNYDKALQKILTENANNFCEAIKNKNKKAIIEAGKSLIGLGIGLTPSGDDYLVGFFAVMFYQNRQGCQEIAKAIIQNAKESTNIISATCLQSAAEKRFSAKTINLIQSVCQNGRNQIEQSLDQLLAIGSTSGTDITKGILDAFFISTLKEAK